MVRSSVNDSPRSQDAAAFGMLKRDEDEVAVAAEWAISESRRGDARDWMGA